MKSKILIFVLLVTALLFSDEPKRPSMVHNVYFEDTENELNVYRLYGRNDGNTIFILGGIQGDEPGGFLSADLYPNIVLEKGNLIVIPRANFHSIINNNRGINGDMNRKFKKAPVSDTEGKIVEIIKRYMGEADLFLNLHDGWGFYSDTYIGPGRNPNRFGQSVIADASTYFNGRDTLRLEKIARTVLKKINQKIRNPKHKLHFMNTKTFEKTSDFLEMKASATYYALTEYGIPAFGIESSKNLNTLEEKILYHNYAINEFMEYFDVNPEHPAIITQKPALKYLIVTVDQQRKVLKDGENLILNKGDKLVVNEIIANCERGLSCDVLGWGSDHDINKPVTITNDNVILVRKDSDVIGKITVTVSGDNNDRFAFLFSVNGNEKVVLADEYLDVSRGDRFTIIDILLRNGKSSQYQVNLKGFVPPDHGSNPGEDRGHLVNTLDLYWKKYSLYGEGKIYPIVVTAGSHEVARAFVRIND